MSGDPTTPPQGATERPSRYDRSFGGLLGAMVVTVVFVAGYVGFRAFFREQPDIVPDVDYLSCVAYLQEADVPVAHPRGLPAGWNANGVHFESGPPSLWRLGLITPDEEFAGVVQTSTDLADLLKTYVDASPEQGSDATPANGLGATTWQTWSDSGGDHALSTTLGSGPLAGQNLLVYGSASPGQLEELVGALTLDPTGDGVSGADCDTDELD